MNDKSDTEKGPFEVRTANATGSVARKHHSLGGANTYTNAPGDEGPLLEPPVRKYGCANYENCLDLAATLNWASFTCKQCCGEINGALQWRAHQIRRRDSLAQAICDLPRLSTVEKPEVGQPLNEDGVVGQQVVVGEEKGS